MAPRYLLQRVNTNQWLTRDFELSEGTWTRALNGPGSVNGFIDPHWRDQTAADGKPLLWEWGTIIYREGDDGRVDAGIVTRMTKDGSRLTLEAPGFATYPHGIPYSDRVNFGRTDPMVPFRHLWFHVQNMPNAHLGVVVDSVATPETSWIGNNAEPYGLDYWENKDCGAEIDSLRAQTPFDYDEIHTWTDANKTALTHRIRVGYPRLGRKREDLRFAEGENLSAPVVVEVDGDDYANEIIGIGKGEGAKMVHSTTTLVDGRLRRPKVVTDKTADLGRIESIIEAELNKRLQVADISQITVVDHINARISAINPGDDILVQLRLPWGGVLRLWLRVLSITGTDANPAAVVLATQRSDSFIYNATTEV